jgi:CMP-N,N'-diacetyllegionaminic acid synthase
MKLLIIIPAKLDSKRLEKKNIQLINNKTLVEHSIDYAKASSCKKEIIISSESNIVKDIALRNNVKFLEREKSLCGDTEVVDVYINILQNLDEKYDYVVALQPDHPDREHTLDYCLDYMIENNYDDLITIEPNFKRSGSVRIFKYEFLINQNVSKRIGCLRDSATDIHYLEDLNKAKNKMS